MRFTRPEYARPGKVVAVLLLFFFIWTATPVSAREARHESLGIEAARSAPGFILFADGKPRATIVIPANAGKREQFIAEDLQRVIEKMCGSRLPIKSEGESPGGNRLQIGRTKMNLKLLEPDGLMPEGFRIKLADNNLCMVGRDDAGTEFAVYTFLERYCDIGWFWPGELGEVITKSSTMAFGQIDDLEEPDFLQRKILVKPRGHLPAGDFHQSEKQHFLYPSPLETQLWLNRNRLGGSVEYAGAHTWGKMAPPDKYGPTHPEYFALKKGKRQWENFNGKHGCQLCTTHPGVVKLGIQWARKYFDENPQITYVSISPNDGLGFCECARCRALDKAAGSPRDVISDRIFTFANQIAAGVKETHPDRGVLMLAYSQYRVPPFKVKPADNVCVQLCINCDRFWSEKKKRQAYEILSGWADTTNNLAIWEYYVWRGSADLPRCFTPLVEESIRRFHQQGARLFYTQSMDNFGAYAMTYYVASRLLWNVDASAEQCVDEFCRKCFGKAAEPMRKWFQMLDDRWRYAVETKGPGLYGGSPAYWLAMFPPHVLAEARARIEEAKRLADGADTRRRVEFFEKELKYTELTLKALRLLKDLERAGIVDLDDDYPTHLKKDEDRYIEIDLASDASKQATEGKGQKARIVVSRSTARDLLLGTIAAWENRNAYIEELRGQHVIDYWHVKENADRDYGHDPTAKLKKLLSSKYKEKI